MTRRRGLATVALVVVVGLLATAIVALWAQRREANEARAEIHRAAQRVELAVRSELEAFAVHGVALAVLAEEVDAVTSAEWSRLVEATTLADEPVFGVNLAAFGLTPNGTPSLEIQRVHPVATNRDALGFDVLTNPSAAAAVRQAILAGAPRMSDAITLRQRQDRADGLVMYAPVGPADPTGAVTVVFEGQEIVEAVARLIGVNLAMWDTNGETSNPLGRSSDPAEFTDRPVVSSTIDAYGQRWDVEVAALEPPGRGVAGIVVAAGVLATAVLGLLALSVANAEERAQQMVRAKTSELQRAARIKDDIIAVVSHELRTPLTVIWGFASTLLTHERASLSPTGLTAMEKIEQNASRLEALVDEMLTSAKVASGDKVATPTEVSMPPAVEEVVRHFADDGTVMTDVPVGCRALVDSRDLTTILHHLVGNGIKYGEGAVSVVVQQLDDTVLIRISDGGVGLDPTRAELLFDRFEQGDTGDSRATRGVGLGLWLVRQLAELNGGSARYRQGPPHAFIVELPSAPANTPIPTPPVDVVETTNS